MWKFDKQEQAEEGTGKDANGCDSVRTFDLKGPAGENLIQPACISVSKSGEFVVSDPESCFIVIYSNDGSFLSHFSTLPQCNFYVFLNIDIHRPYDVGWLSTRKIVYTQPKGCKILISDWKGNISTCIQGRPLYEPHSIDVDDGDRIFVSDREKARILIYTAEGKLLQTIGLFSSVSATLFNPFSVTLGSSGHIIVGDINKGRVIINIYHRNGDLLETILTGIKGGDQFQGHVAIDNTGNILHSEPDIGSVVILQSEKLARGDNPWDLDKLTVAEKIGGMTFYKEANQLIVIDQNDKIVKLYPWQPIPSVNGVVSTSLTTISH